METVPAAFYLNDWLVDPSLDCIGREGLSSKIEQRHMQVLLLLAKHAGEVVSIQRIEDEIWGNEVVTQNTIHQAIAQLRRALRDAARAPRYIETVPRRGYRLIARTIQTSAAEAISASGPKTVAAASAAADLRPIDSLVPAALPPATVSRTAQRIVSRRLKLAVAGILFAGVCSGAAWLHFEARNAAMEASRADEAASFMLNVFSWNPNVSSAHSPTARQLLDTSVFRVMADLKQQPRTQARLLEAIGASYLRLRVGEKALEPLQQSLKIRRELSGKLELANTLELLAAALRDTNRFDDSELAYHEALQLRAEADGQRTPDYATTRMMLGNLKMFRDQPREAMVLFNESLATLRSVRGPRHSEVAAILVMMNYAYLELTDLSNAERTVREALQIYEKSLPELHPNRVIAEYALGETLLLQGNFREADSVLERALRAQRKLYGSEGEAITQTLLRLGEARFKLHRSHEGEQLIGEAIAILGAMETADEQLGRAKSILAVQLLELHQYQRSERLLREAIELHEASTQNATHLANTKHFLGEALLGQHRLAAAEAMLRDAIALFSKGEMPSWTVERSRSTLGEVLYRQGLTEQGARMIIESQRQLASDRTALPAAKQRATLRMRLLHGAPRQATRHGY